jgi:dihydropteroate synthase
MGHRPGTRVEDLQEEGLARECLAGLGLTNSTGSRASLPLPCRVLRLVPADAAEIDDLAAAAGAAGAILVQGPRGCVLAGPARTLDEAAAHLARSPQAGNGLARAAARALAGFRRRRFPLRFADGEVWELEERTRLMGILNVTPDSFYDGGRWAEAGPAVDHGLRLTEEGADLVDVGGESSRPGSAPVSAEEEVRRVVPVVAGLRQARPGLRISVDTRRSDTARRVLEAGADMINDISGLRSDPALAAVVAAAGVPLVVMHIRGTPSTMQQDTDYDDLLTEVVDALAESRDFAGTAGIPDDRLIVDPGIGFGKSAEGNEQILRHLATLRSVGLPLLVGASRKSFIGQRLDGVPPDDRLEGSLAAAAAAIRGGAHIIRVHDVQATLPLARVTDAVGRGR